MTSSARAAGEAPADARRPWRAVWGWAARKCLCWALLLGAASAAAATPDPAGAAAVKAAYLYKFLHYVELPAAALPSPESTIVIGVAGADDVYAALVDVLRERSAGSRPVQARHLADGESLAGVHVLFAGAKVDPQHSPLIRSARDKPLLLVTDSADGLKAGACINFVMLRNRVRFEVSLDAAERHSIKISSRVLALAERVTGAQ
jgi:hypothetical protein